jgi:hypothetical protein
MTRERSIAFRVDFDGWVREEGDSYEGGLQSWRRKLGRVLVSCRHRSVWRGRWGAEDGGKGEGGENGGDELHFGKERLGV